MLVEAVVPLRFPAGRLPVAGWRCPECGEEQLQASEVRRAERHAALLGLYGVTGRRRRLQRTGNSVTVSLDPQLLKDLGGLQPGDEVVVGRLGNRIVIEAAD